MNVTFFLVCMKLKYLKNGRALAYVMVNSAYAGDFFTEVEAGNLHRVFVDNALSLLCFFQSKAQK